LIRIDRTINWMLLLAYLNLLVTRRLLYLLFNILPKTEKHLNSIVADTPTWLYILVKEKHEWIND